MSSSPSSMRGPALFLLAFRPFFLAAALWAAAALCLWMGMLLHGWALPLRFDPMSWHVHEMLFGFVLAAVAGFLLTAIPNWTGRPPVQGGALAALFLLWIAGRVVALVGALVPFWAGVAVDVAFPLVLCVIAARDILVSGNRRNLPMPVPLAVLGVADLLMYLENGGFGVPAGIGWRLGVAAILILISVIGGRIIPAFTSNWLLRHRPGQALPAGHGAVDGLALGTLHAGLIAWVFLPEWAPVGLLLLAGAAFNLWRLLRWRGVATTAEPILLILHIGYAWLIAGAALLGASMLTDAVPLAAALHACTAGAMGTTILAVMTRVSLGHTGRLIRADTLTNILYVAVIAAGLLRVAAAFPVGPAIPLLTVSAALWIVSFLLFVARYAAILCTPRFA